MIMSKLTGKIAIVSGASRAIGVAIAKALASEGTSLAANYAFSKTGADAVSKSIVGANGKAIPVGGMPRKHQTPRVLAQKVGRARALSARTSIPVRSTRRRLDQSEHAAAVVVFLAPDDARWITGETLLTGYGLH
jgi:NAD(P)-dependent dehydrogenase (short-subunit alcohol dehydrogenase family)